MGSDLKLLIFLVDFVGLYANEPDECLWTGANRFFCLKVFTFAAKQIGIDARSINLKLNSTQLNQVLTKDGTFYYLDAYTSTCLDNIAKCENGIGLMVNLTAADLPDADYKANDGGRVVLISSGGDSPYSIGGFYLHQYSINGEKYMEFGVSIRAQLYSLKLYISPNDPVKLLFTWDTNGLNAYVDGVFYDSVRAPTKRAYTDVKFDPIKWVKTLIERRGSTVLWNVMFYDSVLEANNTELIADSGVYFRGCILNSKITANTEFSGDAAMVIKQCKNYCIAQKNQVYAIDRRKCACINTVETLFRTHKPGGVCTCSSSDCTAWSAYIATHGMLDVQKDSLGLTVSKYNVIEPYEVEMPIAIKVSTKINNTRIYVDFDDGTVKSFINSGIAVHEYQNTGMNFINITAISLSNKKFWEDSQLEYRLNRKADRNFMQAVKIYVNEISNQSVDYRIFASGGAPFTCFFNLGDNSRIMTLEGVNRTTNFRIQYIYASSGLYNVSIQCRSDNMNQTILNDWRIMYLPDPLISSQYTVKDSKYYYENIKRIFVTRKATPEEIELELPFKFVPFNFQFQVIDALNPTNSFVWTHSKRQVQIVNYAIKLTTSRLLGTENYFYIKSNDLFLASYIIIVERKIETLPQITLLTSPAKPNEITLFNVKIPLLLPNSILRVEFGDGNYGVVKFDGIETNQSASFEVEHTYFRVSQFYAKAILSNHMSTVQNSERVVFDLRLPDFQLGIQENVTDTTEEVVFQLTRTGSKAIVIDKIIFKEDESNKNDPGTVVQTEYTFDEPVFTYRYKYQKYGIFNASLQIVNADNTFTAYVSVKVGQDLTNVTTFVFNSYALIGEFVRLYFEVDAGNAYDVQIQFSDTQLMTIPWSFIQSGGVQQNLIVRQGQVRPNLQFVNPRVMYILYQYQRTGEYNINMTITNPFGSIQYTLCSKVIIAPPLQGFPSFAACPISLENIDARLSTDQRRSDTLKLSRGLANTLTIKFQQCDQDVLDNGLRYFWTITKAYEDMGMKLTKPVGQFCFIETAKNELVIDKGQLDFGEYNLTTYVVNKRNPSMYRQLKSRTIVLEAANLIAKFKGPSEVELNWNDTYVIDFMSLTVDPESTNPNDKRNLNYDILCIKESMDDMDGSVIKQVENEVEMRSFDFKSIDFQLGFEYNRRIRFFERGCFHESTREYLRESILFDYDSFNFIINMSTLHLNESNGLPLTFQMYVYDDYRVAGARQTLSLNASNSYLSIPLNGNLDMMSKQLDKLDDLASKDPKLALKFVGSFANALNNINTNASGEDTTTTRASVNTLDDKMSNMRGKVLGTMDKIVGGVDDPMSMMVAASATDAVTSNSNQMPPSNQESGSTVLEKMGEKARLFKDLDVGAASDLTASILGASGNMFDAAIKSTPLNEENRTIDLNFNETEEVVVVVEPPKKIAAPIELYHNCDDCEDFPEDRYEEQKQAEEKIAKEEEEKRKKSADIAKKSMNGVSGAADALTSSISNGTSASVQKKGLALTVAKRAVNESDAPQTFDGDSSGSKISMPKFSDILDTSSTGSVQTKLVVSNSNPYQSASSKSGVKGSIVSLSLNNENGEEMSINGTKEPFVINIPNVAPVGVITTSVKLLDYKYHKMYLSSNGSALSVVLQPLVKGDYYHVYISHTPNKTIEQYPNEEHHDYAFTVPKSNATYDETNANEVDLHHTVFISNNETKGVGYYYIGIKVAKISQQTKNDTIMNATVASHYNLKIFSPSCKYWKEDTKDWRTDGCFVSPNTTADMTQCFCYHLTTFGTDFYVPPNTIDFSNVWAKFAKLNENAGVFSTVVSILGLYVILAIWARHMDKKDLIKWGAAPLVDNLPTDNYYYLVSVQTGVGRDTATTSNVGFVIVGEQADSGVRKLSDGKRIGFPSGSVYNYIMGVDEPLGNLTYLRVWHDNSGKGNSASWHLNMINVLDIQTNEKSNFVCDQWLAVEKGDGEIDRILPVASHKDLSNFKHLFTQSVKKKFTDGHLWFSVFSRPTKSSFTRLQRMSCCLSLLFCTMIANAMFYQAEDKNKPKTAVRLGPISFTLSQLFTSVVSTMIVVPVNLIIVTIFRKAKLKHSGIIPTKTQFVAKQQHWRRVTTLGVLGKGDMTDNRTMIQRIKDWYAARKQENRTVEYKRDEDLEKRNQKQGRTYPYWTIYIAWVLVFLSIIVPAFFIILYSMEWGRDRSNAWLATMMLSFFQSVLVVDPVKVFIITAVITMILRKPDDDEDLFDSGDPFYNAIANKDEEFLNTTASLSQVNIQEALQSRRAKLSSLKVLDPLELSTIREQRIKEIKMGEIIREMISYLCFLVILLFLCHQSRHTNSFLMYNNMKQTFVDNPIKPFEEIRTRPDFWTYLQDVFLPNLYAQTWYNNASLTWREKLTLNNRYSIRVGAPRIRQLRVKDPSCRVSPMFKSIIKNCRSDYNWFDDDAKSYEEGWVPLPNDTTKVEKKKCKTPWCYQNSIQTKSVPIMGAFTTYKGGGYVITLGRTIQRALKVLEEAKSSGWVDQLTRAMFFEFTVYNPNVNLFASVTIIIEYLSTGAAINYHDIKVFRLYNYVGSFGVVVLTFQIIFVCFLVYFVYTEIVKIKNQGVGYFKEFWNLNEMVMVIFSIVSIAMYVMKNTFTTLAMKAVRESELSEFVNFNTISLWDDTFTSILAVVSFCATLKFMKLLRFNKRIGMLAQTLKYASADLSSFSFTLFVFVLAYTQFGYLLYGSVLPKYKSFLASLESVFLLLLGQFDFDDMMNANGFLGIVYLFTFIFIVFIGLMAMFMTILEQAFEQVKADVANQDNEHEMVDFIFSSVKKLVGFNNKMANKKKKQDNEDEDNGDDGDIKKEPLATISGDLNASSVNVHI